MNEQLITWQLKTVYIVTFVLCTTSIVPNNLHRTSNMLNFHTALYSLMQKAVKLNTCRSQKTSDTKLKTQTWYSI
jgi:hypothetical protein